MSKGMIEASRVIDASIDEVFAKATAVDQWADMISGIEKVERLTEGDVGLGTRFRETRIMFGKEAVEEMEFTIFEPPRRYALGAENHGTRYHSEFNLEKEGTGTKVTFSFHATPLTFFAKVMSVLMRPMMKKMLEICEKDLDDLKAAIEKA